MNGLTESEIRQVLIDAVQTDGSVEATAARLGFVASYIRNVVNGDAPITVTLADRLGYTPVTVYVPKDGQ